MKAIKTITMIALLLWCAVLTYQAREHRRLLDNVMDCLYQLDRVDEITVRRITQMHLREVGTNVVRELP